MAAVQYQLVPEFERIHMLSAALKECILYTVYICQSSIIWFCQTLTCEKHIRCVWTLKGEL